MTAAFLDDRRKAALYAVAAVATASTQDAVVKLLSGTFPASQTVFFRAIVAALILLPWMLAQRQRFQMWPANVHLLLLRGLILCFGYFCFVLSIAALPIATSVSIYFTMPFFVAALAGRALGEKVKAYRWIAITSGFAGVMLMVRPGAEAFEPAALLALASAMGYAVGQLLSRHVSQFASPVVVTFWQSVIYGVAAILLTAIAPFFEVGANSGKVAVFLLRPWTTPDALSLVLLIATGVLATFGSLFFVQAYRHAEANFVAPFEYTSLLWAVSYGLLLFGDFPDLYTWLGAGIVVAAGLWMLHRDWAEKAAG